MKRFDFAIAPKELAEAMMADLGNGPTTANGDRSSTYFLVAKAAEERDGEVTAALIENKAGLEPDEQFYGVHLIDDISMSDCRLVSTDSPFARRRTSRKTGNWTTAARSFGA